LSSSFCFCRGGVGTGKKKPNGTGVTVEVVADGTTPVYRVQPRAIETVVGAIIGMTLVGAQSQSSTVVPAQSIGMVASSADSTNVDDAQRYAIEGGNDAGSTNGRLVSGLPVGDGEGGCGEVGMGPEGGDVPFDPDPESQGQGGGVIVRGVELPPAPAGTGMMTGGNFTLGVM
jgi:hypothetical protein